MATADLLLRNSAANPKTLLISRFFEKLFFKGAPFPFSAQPCKNWQLTYDTIYSHKEYNSHALRESIINNDKSLREQDAYISNSISFEVKDLNYPNMEGDLFLGNMDSPTTWCLKFHVTNSKGIISVELNRISIDENSFLVEERDGTKHFIGKLQNEESVKAMKEFLKLYRTEQGDGE